MAILTQLDTSHPYRACDWNLRDDVAGRTLWCQHFRWHFHEVLRPLIRTEYPALAAESLVALTQAYDDLFEQIEQASERFPQIDILMMDEVRHALLASHGCPDPFRGVKAQETAAALAELPTWLAEVDAAPEEETRLWLAEGVLAGNMFDLGAAATIAKHAAGHAGFHTALEALPQRPWFVDDLNAFWKYWEQGGAQHVLWFVDNAGSDIVLGVLPMARWLIQRGAQVTLAANSEPALNDVLAVELMELLEQVPARDPELGTAVANGRLTVRASGNAAPLIDLARLDADFVTAVASADLVWLHGMGRAVESNRLARFRVPAVWTAMIKDESVADYCGANLFDCVFRFVRPL